VTYIQVRYLGAIGGKDVPETTRRIMSNIMTTAVARQMNFAGRGGKVAIQNMKLLRVIIGMKFTLTVSFIVLHLCKRLSERFSSIFSTFLVGAVVVLWRRIFYFPSLLIFIFIKCFILLPFPYWDIGKISTVMACWCDYNWASICI
jgi:hypothetical protein